jgi:hypothetical protein
MPELAFPLKFKRTFQIWSYSVSHSVLLLRSPQTATTPTRIDLMFRAVQEMRLRSRMEDIEIRTPQTEMTSGTFVDVRISGGRSLFVVSTADPSCGFVVANSLYMSEDDLSYGEPSTIDAPELADNVISSGYFNS